MKGYKIYQGSQQVIPHGSSQYRVAPNTRIDEVVLRFDEEEQKFYARINNPSQHTQYLFNHNKLGIALCKCTTGKSWGKAPYGSYHVSDTEYKYHPRWTRYGQHFVPVTTLVQEFEIQYEWQWLIPQTAHSLHDWHEGFYTKIKALLLSLPYSFPHSWYVEQECGAYGYDQLRGYKTYCNAIPITVASSGQVSIRKSGMSQGRKYQYESLTVAQIDNTHYQVTINNPNQALQQQINQGHVYVALEYNQLSKYVRGACMHAYYGDLNYPYTDMTPELEQFIQARKRWRFRLNKKLATSDGFATQFITNTVSYELPTVVHPVGLDRLIHIVKKHKTESMTVIVQAPSLKIIIGRPYNPLFGCIGRVTINRQYQGYINHLTGSASEITLV